MTLRGRLLLAQAPLALALALVGLMSLWTLSELGKSGQRILAENYRSVLAAQRMKESIERIDSGALFRVGGDEARGREQVERFRPVFEAELQVQEGNVTEPGELELTRRLRAAWGAYQRELTRHLAERDPKALGARYRAALEPVFYDVKAAADAILDLNQDAMVRRSEEQRRLSERVNGLTLVGLAAALALGLLAALSLLHRALRPVSVLTQAVRRVGEGDLGARADVREAGELGQLVRDFNAMADRLQAYRQSTLGELLRAQAASQAAIDALPDPVVVFGLAGVLLNVNHAADRVLGLSVAAEGDVLGRLGPEVRGVLERVRAHVLSGKGPYVPRGYEEAVRVDGPEGPGYYLPRATGLYGEGGGVVGAAVVLQDVTRLKRFDELKNDLVATVAHEVRTPLTSLRMAIHLAAEGVAGPLTAKQAELLRGAREDCERLQGIVDDLLDLSRIQSGQLALEPRPTRTDEVLEAALGPHRAAAAQKGLVLDSSVEVDGEPFEADAERLALALSNLVANAVRHTPAGGRVHVGVAHGAGRVRFEVTDTGPGVPPEHRTRIFEKFYRVPGAPSGGAGLGLAIVRDIAEAHGGEVAVDAAPGGGARFTLSVPARARR